MATNDGVPNAETKDGKRFFNFSFAMSKKAEEQTEMTNDFNLDVQHFVDYDEAVTKIVQLIENCYIPIGAKNESKDYEDAFHRFSVALNNFRAHTPPQYSGSLEKFSINMKSASVLRAKHQKDAKYQLRHLRRFHIEKFQVFVNQRKVFDEARRKMDNAKAEVREAKTTANIEKKAICYQMAVDDFDTQTESLLKLISDLPAGKASNARDFINLMGKQKVYHSDIAKYFKFL